MDLALCATRIRGMRFAPLAGIGIVAALAVELSTGLGVSGTRVPHCARNFEATAPKGLPAPVLLQTRCARFLVQPDRSVSAEPLPPTPTARVGSQDLGSGYWLA